CSTGGGTPSVSAPPAGGGAGRSTVPANNHSASRVFIDGGSPRSAGGDHGAMLEAPIRIPRRSRPRTGGGSGRAPAHLPSRRHWGSGVVAVGLGAGVEHTAARIRPYPAREGHAGPAFTLGTDPSP